MDYRQEFLRKQIVRERMPLGGQMTDAKGKQLNTNRVIGEYNNKRRKEEFGDPYSYLMNRNRVINNFKF